MYRFKVTIDAMIFDYSKNIFLQKAVVRVFDNYENTNIWESYANSTIHRIYSSSESPDETNRKLRQSINKFIEKCRKGISTASKYDVEEYELQQ